MKSFKVDIFKYIILPIITLGIVISYIFLFWQTTPMYINILNIFLDIIILLVYLKMFIYRLDIDDFGIDVKGVFTKKRIILADLKSLNQGGILTMINTKRGKFFVLSSKKEKEELKQMFSHLKVRW